jgi:hypothetical protein
VVITGNTVDGRAFQFSVLLGFSIFHTDPDKNVNSSMSRVDLLLLLVS